MFAVRLVRRLEVPVLGHKHQAVVTDLLYPVNDSGVVNSSDPLDTAKAHTEDVQ